MRRRWILVAAAMGVVLFGYPGLMSYDSVTQLDQARRWDLGDWHPPAMALVWRAVELVFAGPAGMLLLQVAAFVIGAYLVLRDSMAAKAAAWVTLGLCWYPPVLTVMGVIWKDSQMAGYLLLGIGALLSPSRRVRWAGVLVLVVASAMRHNAAAATFAPVLLLWGAENADQPKVKRFAIAAAVWLGITLAAVGLNATLAQRSEHPWSKSVAVTDIAGIVRWSPPLDDAYLKAVLAGTPLRVDSDIQRAMIEKYEPRGWLLYYQVNPPLALPETEPEHEAIGAAWFALVKAHPGAYLRHRWEVFRKVLHLGGKARVPPLTLAFSYPGDPALDERLSHRASPSSFQRVVFPIVKKVGGVLYVPYIYLVVSLVLLWLARRRSSSRRATASSDSRVTA